MQFLWDSFVNEEDSVLFFIFLFILFSGLRNKIKEQNQESLFEIVIAVTV